jgi:hypothetical protein
MKVLNMFAPLIAALICLSGCAEISALAQEHDSADPAKVRIVTSDIPRFWRAFDDAAKSSDPAAVYQRDYFDGSSAGVRGFTPGRLVSARHLAETVSKAHAYYAATRPYMAQLEREKPQIYADLYRYKKLYPPARFPDVYVVVGALNSAGTSTPAGLVLGAEMLSRPPNYAKLLPPNLAQVVSTADRVPATVAHEFTHYNQVADPDTLLGQTIKEGTADFMAEMVDARGVTPAQWKFGCAHEAALFKQFTAQMQTTDMKVQEHWLFSYERGPLGAPPFIGYWLGSRIAQTYYVTHGKTTQAIAAIMQVRDYDALLRESGYPQHRPPCVPPRA